MVIPNHMWVTNSSEGFVIVLLAFGGRVLWYMYMFYRLILIKHWWVCRKQSSEFCLSHSVPPYCSPIPSDKVCLCLLCTSENWPTTSSEGGTSELSRNFTHAKVRLLLLLNQCCIGYPVFIPVVHDCILFENSLHGDLVVFLLETESRQQQTPYWKMDLWSTPVYM